MQNNFLELFYLLPLNRYLLPLKCHCLNELLEHLDAVPLLYISLVSCSETQLRNSCRLIEQGVANNVFFILDVEVFPLINISSMATANWFTRILELLSVRLLFLHELGYFSLELPPVDQIHHYHQSSQGR